MSTESGTVTAATLRPWVWIALAACAMVTVACWGASSPIGSSPDDDFHLASIWCADGPATGAAPGGVCTEVNGNRGSGAVDRVVPEAVFLADCAARSFPSVQACTTFKVGQVCDSYQGPPSIACTAGLRPGTGVHAANAGLYPPGFYLAMHPLASESVTRSVLWMRALNGVLAILVIGAALVVSRGRSRAAYALMVAMGVMTPIGLVFIPSTNPSSWSIIGIGSLWLFVLTFMATGSGWRRWLAGIGSLLTWGLAVVARADAPVLTALTIGAAAVIGNRGLRPTPKLLAPVALIVASAVIFVAGSGSAVVSSGISTVAAGDGNSPDPSTAAQLAHNAAHPWHLFGHNLSAMWAYERDMFSGAVSGDLLAYALTLLVIVAVAWHRGWGRAVYAALLVAGFAIPLYVAQKSHLDVAAWYLQRRYLFPLMLAVLGLGFLGLVRAGHVQRIARRPWIGRALWVLLSVVASLAFHEQIRRYVIGWHSNTFNLDRPRVWWWANLPLSPMGLWTVGSVAMAAVLALLFKIAVQSLRVEPAVSPAPTTIVPRESSAA